MVAEQTTGGKIFEAIPKMIAECEHIGKDKKNQQQGFMYRGVDDVYNAVHPLLAKHGVFPTNEIIEDVTTERTSKSGGTLFHTRLKVRYWFNATDGSRVPSEVIGEGMDSGDKASNKAMSIAYKYALFQLLCIPTMAVDPDSETHEVSPREKALKSLKEEVGKISPNQKRTQELIDHISQAKDEGELNAIAEVCKREFAEKKITKQNLEYLGSVSRQKRQSLAAMQEQNDFFDKSLNRELQEAAE